MKRITLQEAYSTSEGDMIGFRARGKTSFERVYTHEGYRELGWFKTTIRPVFCSVTSWVLDLVGLEIYKLDFREVDQDFVVNNPDALYAVETKEGRRKVLGGDDYIYAKMTLILGRKVYEVI